MNKKTFFESLVVGSKIVKIGILISNIDKKKLVIKI